MSRLDSELVKKVLENIEVSTFLRATIASSINDCSAISQLTKEVKSLRDANSRLTNQVSALMKQLNITSTKNSEVLPMASLSSSVNNPSASNTSSLSKSIPEQPIDQQSLVSQVTLLPAAPCNTEVKAAKEDFTRVERKVRMKKPIFGSGVPSSILTAAPPSSWIYVGRLNKDTTEDNIMSHLKLQWPNGIFTCNDLKNKGNNSSFKVGSSNISAEAMLTPESWPPNILLKPFSFFRRPREIKENN